MEITVYVIVGLLAILISAVKVLREYERGVIFLLGRFQRVKGPGLIIVIPFIQQIERIDLRVVVMDVPTQDVISQDNVSVKVNAVVYFRVIDPEKAVRAIDSGWVGYRWYFLRKWRQALVEKQGAFPDAYDLDAALKLPSVAALTDYLVARHLPFVHSREYYQHYTLTGNGLAGLEIPTRILAAADDPVVPIGDVETLDGSRHLDVVVSRFGGHCGFIEDFRLRSALDWYTPEFFTSKLL